MSAETPGCGSTTDAKKRAAEKVAEEGRVLANQRDDLIAVGVDPSLLEVPLAPAAESKPTPGRCFCGNTVAGDAGALEQARADSAAHAMWRFFLTLPGPSPLSDAVQREAMRLRAAAMLPTDGAEL